MEQMDEMITDTNATEMDNDRMDGSLNEGDDYIAHGTQGANNEYTNEVSTDSESQPEIENVVESDEYIHEETSHIYPENNSDVSNEQADDTINSDARDSANSLYRPHSQSVGHNIPTNVLYRDVEDHEEDDDIQNSLSLNWVFGINRQIVGGVHNLSDEFREAVFYTSGHVGVIYKIDKKQQVLLQGHVHPITCSCVSNDKRWIVTADAGMKNMLVVWDSLKGIPVKTIYEPHSVGIQAVDISNDSMYIATLSCLDDKSEVTLSIWEWTSEDTSPMYTAVAPSSGLTQKNSTSGMEDSTDFAKKFSHQTCVKFHYNNPHLLATNGSRIITFWNWDSGQLVYYNPSVTAKDFRQAVGEFTVSCFVPNTSLVVTGTKEGEVVLWQKISDTSNMEHEKKAFKVVKVHPGHSINIVTCIRNYIVTGGEDGQVKFLDHQLRLEAWFEEFAAGPIMSISFNRVYFSNEDSVLDNSDAASVSTARQKSIAARQDEFSCPDFMISTSLAFVIRAESKAFNEYNPKSLRGELIVLGQEGAIQALAAHPKKPHLVISGLSGHIHLWDYSSKKVVKITELANLHVSSMAFDPKGEYLVIGCTNGIIKILDGSEIEEMQHFRPSHAAILDLKFSHDSLFIAVTDSDNAVGLFRWDHKDQNPSKNVEWVYIGRFKSHKKPIAGVEFGIVPFGDVPRLMSVGEDRRLIEYDLVNSSIAEGILLKSVHLVSQSSVPTAFIWTQEQGVMEKYKNEPSEFDTLILSDNHYKFTQFITPDSNRDTRCLKTKIAPTFGAPLNKMILVPNIEANGSLSKPKLMAYSTHEKVVGLIHLPITGDHNRAMGLIAHSGDITACVVSPDGQYMFTAGGSDCTVNQWKINGEYLERLVAKSTGIGPFIEQVDGGPDGDFFQEIKHMFYYAQIRSQGEITTKERKIKGEVALDQIPNLMRSIGFYASNWEIFNIINELKMIVGENSNGNQNSEEESERSGHKRTPLLQMDEVFIDFDTFVKVYVNHRPLFDIEAKDIEDGFKTLGAEPMTGVIRRDQLLEKLNTLGERISEQELLQCLSTLKDEEVHISSLENRMTASSFVHWLGFEYSDVNPQTSTTSDSNSFEQNEPDEFQNEQEYEYEDEDEQY